MTAGAIAVLANPTAGRGRRRGLLPVLVERLAASGHPVRPLDAGTPEEAEAACHAAVAEGAVAVIAVGGDGTVHRALQAVAGTDTPLGIIPTGTGNDLAAEVGLPAEPVAAADVLATAVREGSSRRVDLARISGPDDATRWYGAVLAAGFDAIVNERANGMRWPRGDRRYDIAILIELIRLRPRHYTLCLDGAVHEVDAVLLAVGNAACYGGGMRICPAADLTDGLLDVVLAGPISRTTFARIKPRVYAGTHVQHPMVSQFQASTVEIAAEGIITYADGERSCPLPVTVTCMPGALTVLG
ncbi:MAG TPA: diacylglycerol kinase family protein [Micromonosporaceae bacterium]|jgi:diacylglycerol kinase (ATP)|nr:diacylglycerol kinase family protein [Micromonosporaceae bacterium]